jgi:cell division protein FtsB
MLPLSSNLKNILVVIQMEKLISLAALRLLQDCKIKNIELARANEELTNEVNQLKTQIAQLQCQKVQLPPQQSLGMLS